MREEERGEGSRVLKSAGGPPSELRSVSDRSLIEERALSWREREAGREWWPGRPSGVC